MIAREDDNPFSAVTVRWGHVVGAGYYLVCFRTDRAPAVSEDQESVNPTSHPVIQRQTSTSYTLDDDQPQRPLVGAVSLRFVGR